MNLETGEDLLKDKYHKSQKAKEGTSPGLKACKGVKTFRETLITARNLNPVKSLKF